MCVASIVATLYYFPHYYTGNFPHTANIINTVVTDQYYRVYVDALGREICTFVGVELLETSIPRSTG